MTMSDENRYEGATPSTGAAPPVFPPANGGGSTSGTASPPGGGTESVKDEAQQVAGRAADGAEQVAGVAADRASDVAETAKEQVKDTAAEAKQQARSLYEQGRQEITDQAGAQQQRLAGGMRSVSSELSSMAQSSQEPGLATTVAQQLAERLDSAGSWLEQREPAQVLDEVSRYARRHPVAFMAIAAGLGLLAGRVARSAKDAAGDSSSGGSGTATSTGPSGRGAQPYGTPPAQPYSTTGTQPYGTTGTPPYSASDTSGYPQEAPLPSGAGGVGAPGAPGRPVTGSEPVVRQPGERS